MCFLKLMASHQRDFPTQDDVIIPWNRRYTFPTVANKATKTTPRIQPITGGSFGPGNTIQINFPAQGYMNPINSFLSFDVTITPNSSDSYGNGSGALRFQNNIQSIFERVEVKYGATHLEDINNYNLIVRPMSEWTSTSGYDFDQTSISEGLGGVVPSTVWDNSGAGIPTTPAAVGLSNIRQKYIQGVDSVAANVGGFGNRNLTRRYCVQLMTGLFQQRKLIPLKWMASQFSILLTLCSGDKCLFADQADATSAASYLVSNVNFIPELLEFDSSFDAYLLAGLKNGGMPIKFSTWRYYQAPATQANNIPIMESAKSLKSIFSFLKRTTPARNADYGAMPFFPGAFNTLLSYQYRIGGRYYPSAPVQCGFMDGATGAYVSNGGSEAYMELAKALYTVGDYKLSSSCNSLTWGYPIANRVDATTYSYTNEAESDFSKTDVSFLKGTFGTKVSRTAHNTHGNVGSQCFAMAISLETASSVDYSGLNAEEQSNIIFNAIYSAPPGSVAGGAAAAIDYSMVTFTFIDKMIVLGENNKLTVLE